MIRKKVLKIIAVVLAFVFAVQLYSAGKYRIAVNVLEENESPGINPTDQRFDFGDLPKGMSSVRYLSLENNGNFKIWVVVLKFGSISELIQVSRDNFILEPGKSEKLGFQLRMPASADKPSYGGWVLVFKTPVI